MEGNNVIDDEMKNETGSSFLNGIFECWDDGESSSFLKDQIVFPLMNVTIPQNTSSNQLNPLGECFYKSECYYINTTTWTGPTYLTEPIYGYVMPMTVILTLISNSLTVVVLSQKHMRSPTNCVLLAMAIADLLTCIFPMPWYIYIYTLRNQGPIQSCSFALAYEITFNTLPQIFHTASIWLTLALAVQRYIYVCHAPAAKIWCTMERTLKAVFFIYTFAFLHQTTRFLDRKFEGVDVEFPVCSKQETTLCRITFADWMIYGITMNVYFISFWWFRVLFVHLFPCISLVIFNCLLFRTMREVEKTRKRLFGNKPKVLQNNRGKVSGQQCKMMSSPHNREMVKQKSKIDTQKQNDVPMETVPLNRETDGELRDSTSERSKNHPVLGQRRSTLLQVSFKRSDTNSTSSSFIFVSKLNLKRPSFEPSSRRRRGGTGGEGGGRDSNGNIVAISVRKISDTNRTTLMLIVVITTFLATELPIGILTVLHVLSSTLHDFLDYENVKSAILILNLFINLTYPLNFAIYCGMSKQFRDTFNSLFINNEYINQCSRRRKSETNFFFPTNSVRIHRNHSQNSTSVKQQQDFDGAVIDTQTLNVREGDGEPLNVCESADVSPMGETCDCEDDNSGLINDENVTIVNTVE